MTDWEQPAVWTMGDAKDALLMEVLEGSSYRNKKRNLISKVSKRLKKQRGEARANGQQNIQHDEQSRVLEKPSKKLLLKKKPLQENTISSLEKTAGNYISNQEAEFGGNSVKTKKPKCHQDKADFTPSKTPWEEEESSSKGLESAMDFVTEGNSHGVPHLREEPLAKKVRLGAEERLPASRDENKAVTRRQVENTPLCLETRSPSAEERKRRKERKVSGAKAETEEVGESPGSRSKARAPEQENLNGAKGVEEKVERDEEEGEGAEEKEKSEVKTQQELDRETEAQKEGVGEARRKKVQGQEASEDGMRGKKANKGRKKGATSKPGSLGGSRKRKAKEEDGGARKKRKKEEECGKEDKWKWYVLRSGWGLCHYYF
ncbi:Hypothetical predicted protein [Podarcis lilfordi]|uniref:Uncharacterized protein n=1 Tax=Podarcis lilfordi TaxID=74358 RepID=A0AA35QQG7_9SAUR|nr:Hypothetical predicted protein [Podarcis lilfordi]